MPQFFVYLLKANIALVIFYVAYRFILRRLTFYSANRWYLLFAILFSSAWPLVHFSQAPATAMQSPATANFITAYSPDWQSLQTVLAQPAQWNAWTVAYYVYWLGVAVFAFLLLVQLASLLSMHVHSSPSGMRFTRFTRYAVKPFSFGRRIYINPSTHTPGELKHIIEHEKVHISQWHTADILLAELNKIFYWFNPGVWLIKNAIRENLEFIADRSVLQSGTDRAIYQYELLNQSAGINVAAGIAGQFAFLHLKKRIRMMNKKASGWPQRFRYFLLLPLLAVVSIVVAQKKQPAHLSEKEFNERIKQLTLNPEKPVWIIDGVPVAVMKNANAYFSRDEVEASPEFKVWLDGIILTMDEANALLKNKALQSVGAMPGSKGNKNMFGYECNLLVLFYKTDPKNILSSKKLLPEMKAVGAANDIQMKKITVLLEKPGTAKPATAAVTDSLPKPLQDARPNFYCTLLNDSMPGPAAGDFRDRKYVAVYVTLREKAATYVFNKPGHIIDSIDYQTCTLEAAKAFQAKYMTTVTEKPVVKDTLPVPNLLIYNNLPDVYYMVKRGNGTYHIPKEEWLSASEERYLLDMVKLSHHESLFAGIENHIVAAVPALAGRKIEMTISRGSVSYAGNGQYSAYVTSAGEAEVKIYAVAAGGERKYIGSRVFKVKLLPPAEKYAVNPDGNGDDAGVVAVLPGREITKPEAERLAGLIQKLPGIQRFTSAGAAGKDSLLSARQPVSTIVVDGRTYSVEKTNQLLGRNIFNGTGN
jgi:hypothetical protein